MPAHVTANSRTSVPQAFTSVREKNLFQYNNIYLKSITEKGGYRITGSRVDKVRFLVLDFRKRIWRMALGSMIQPFMRSV